MKRNLNQPDKTAVLFHITVDPRLTSTPFAPIRDESFHPKEDEVLFSMHTMFLIESVHDNGDQTFTIRLKSISDSDPQLTHTIQQMRHELGERGPFDRLGKLLIILGKYTDAEELYEYYSESVPQQDQKTHAHIYNQLGFLAMKNHDSSVAKRWFKMATGIQERFQPECDLDLANTYSNLGLLCVGESEHQNALDYHKKALLIREKLLDENHADRATTYNNIGLVYDQLHNYADALVFYQKAMKIYQNCFDAYHPWLATLHKNIGLAQISLNDTRDGLNNLHKALEIREKILPNDHPSLLSTYTALYDAYRQVKDTAKAEQYQRKAKEVQERIKQKNAS